MSQVWLTHKISAVLHSNFEALLRVKCKNTTDKQAGGTVRQNRNWRKLSFIRTLLWYGMGPHEILPKAMSREFVKGRGPNLLLSLSSLSKLRVSLRKFLSQLEPKKEESSLLMLDLFMMTNWHVGPPVLCFNSSRNFSCYSYRIPGLTKL